MGHITHGSLQTLVQLQKTQTRIKFLSYFSGCLWFLLFDLVHLLSCQPRSTSSLSWRPKFHSVNSLIECVTSPSMPSTYFASHFHPAKHPVSLRPKRFRWKISGLLYHKGSWVSKPGIWSKGEKNVVWKFWNQERLCKCSAIRMRSSSSQSLAIHPVN